MKFLLFVFSRRKKCEKIVKKVFFGSLQKGPRLQKYLNLCTEDERTVVAWGWVMNHLYNFNICAPAKLFKDLNNSVESFSKTAFKIKQHKLCLCDKKIFIQNIWPAKHYSEHIHSPAVFSVLRSAKNCIGDVCV